MCCFRLTTLLLGEVSGSLANYFSSSQGDAGLPGSPGVPVSSRHFIHILRMLSEYVRNLKRAECIKTGTRTVCKGRCEARISSEVRRNRGGAGQLVIAGGILGSVAILTGITFARNNVM